MGDARGLHRGPTGKTPSARAERSGGRGGAPAGQPSAWFGCVHKESRQECPSFRSSTLAEEGRWQMAEDGATESARWEKPLEASPGKATQSHPKATPRPPQGHILGIDSGVQSHLKATPRLPQGYPKATPSLPQGSNKAPTRPPQSPKRATCRASAIAAGRGGRSAKWVGPLCSRGIVAGP